MIADTGPWEDIYLPYIDLKKMARDRGVMVPTEDQVCKRELVNNLLEAGVREHEMARNA